MGAIKNLMIGIEEELEDCLFQEYEGHKFYMSEQLYKMIRDFKEYDYGDGISEDDLQDWFYLSKNTTRKWKRIRYFLKHHIRLNQNRMENSLNNLTDDERMILDCYCKRGAIYE